MSAPALIVVDVQKAFADPYWGRRDNPDCERNVAALIERWREQGGRSSSSATTPTSPDSPLRPGLPGNEFQDVVTGEPDLLVTKSVNSSFHGEPDLQAWLDGEGVETIYICGITTNHCCETTARVGGNLGYDVRFVLDATHTFDRPDPSGEIVPAELIARVSADQPARRVRDGDRHRHRARRLSRALVNFFYAHPVGHAVEALHYAHGHHVAAPELELSVALNAATAVELARFCPFVERAYAIDHPLLEPCPDSAARLAELPREWDWIADDPRRWQDVQLAMFPGLRDYYAASDEHLHGALRADHRRCRAARLRAPPAAAVRAAAARSLDGGRGSRSCRPARASARCIRRSPPGG